MATSGCRVVILETVGIGQAEAPNWASDSPPWKSPITNPA